MCLRDQSFLEEHENKTSAGGWDDERLRSRARAHAPLTSMLPALSDILYLGCRVCAGVRWERVFVAVDGALRFRRYEHGGEQKIHKRALVIS